MRCPAQKWRIGVGVRPGVQYEVERVSYSKFLERRKGDYERVGVEVIVIPLAKMPVGLKEREKALGEWVWE